MLDVPAKFFQFEILIAFIFLSLGLSFLFSDPQNIYVIVVSSTVGFGLFVHGVLSWRKIDKIERDLKERTLGLKSAKLKLSILSLLSTYDYDADQDDTGGYNINDETDYDITLEITNPSSLDNVVRDVRVSSKLHGNCISLFNIQKIKARDHAQMKIHAILKGKHAKDGDVITVSIIDSDDKEMSANKEVKWYQKSDWYKEMHPELQL